MTDDYRSFRPCNRRISVFERFIIVWLTCSNRKSWPAHWARRQLIEWPMHSLPSFVERPTSDIPFRFVSLRFPSINYFESEIVPINPPNEDTPGYYPIPFSIGRWAALILFGWEIETKASTPLIKTIYLWRWSVINYI